MNDFHCCHAWMPEMVLRACDSGSSSGGSEEEEQCGAGKGQKSQPCIGPLSPVFSGGILCSHAHIEKTKNNAKIYNSLDGAQKARLLLVSVNVTVHFGAAQLQ